MTILDTILERTRETVARRKRETPVSDLQHAPGAARPTVPFAPALAGREMAFIAESKKRSPSKGVIREPYSAADNARAYTRAGAAALSILTEPDFFGGSPGDLAAARAATTLPLLRKDFVVDEYQLFEARAWGADAVLLIAAALDGAHLRSLQQAADALGLGVLVEVHGEAELDRLDWHLARVVGVNNRDLRTFRVDVSRAPRVLARVPSGIVRVAESGLGDAATIAHLHRQGIGAVLIGEAFMRAPDPGAALAALRAEVQALREPKAVTPSQS